TAESCTGGLVAQMITSVPGASEYLDRGFVTYSNQAKQDLLGVPEAILAEHGAVSEPCARAMAEGARARAKTTYALAITGIALAPPEERAAHRRAPAYPRGVAVDLVLTHDLMGAAGAVLVLELDGGAEEDLVPLLLARIDDDGVREPLREEPHTAIDLAELF